VSSWTPLRVEPLDTLFFREARSFTAGEQNEARGVFPPPPATVQGMIRSALIARYQPGALRGEPLGKELCRVVGNLGEPPGTLEVQGPWLLPAPLTLVRRADPENPDQYEAAPLRPRLADGAGQGANLPCGLRPLVPPDGWEAVSAVDGWLTWSAYSAILEGGRFELKAAENWFRPADLWTTEDRGGTAIDFDSRHASEGLLWYTRHVRLLQRFAGRGGDVGIGVLVRGIEPYSITKAAVACPFGGEGRAARISPAEKPPWVDRQVKLTGKTLCVLTTPAWFASGWCPSWADPVAGRATLNGAELGFLAARVERPVRIGGWDLYRRQPKPLRAFAPAGSVYFFEEVANTLGTLCRLCETSITETLSGEEFHKLGFGHALVGCW
jgi:CRISPR-associated protein Cmr3